MKDASSCPSVRVSCRSTARRRCRITVSIRAVATVALHRRSPPTSNLYCPVRARLIHIFFVRASVRHLTAVRDEQALAKLPEAEQKAWRQLWADVAALHKKAGGQP